MKRWKSIKREFQIPFPFTMIPLSIARKVMSVQSEFSLLDLVIFPSIQGKIKKGRRKMK